MKKFLKWWKVWGQGWGFLLLVASVATPLLNDDIREFTNGNVWFGIVWLVMFFGGAAWYAWQMRVHGWEMPEDVRRTHQEVKIERNYRKRYGININDSWTIRRIRNTFKNFR